MQIAVLPAAAATPPPVAATQPPWPDGLQSSARVYPAEQLTRHLVLEALARVAQL